MKFLKFIIIASLILTIACSSNKQKDIEVNFLDSKEYPINTCVTDNANWTSEIEGELFTINKSGLSFPQKSASAIKHTKLIELNQEGDVATVGAEFMYDQVEGYKKGEIFRLGFSNGESMLMAKLNWYSQGNLSFMVDGRAIGNVMHTSEFGLPRQDSEGSSQKLNFSVSLTKKSGDLYDMTLYLKNVEDDSVYPRYWTEKDVRFEKGNSNQLKAVLQNGVGRLPQGIVNKKIFSLAINSKKLPIPEKDWKGVDFVSYFKPIEPQSKLASEGTWGAKNVMPRDTANGLEDTNLSDWCYWDGSIVKDDEGKYHMYASRWTQTVSHGIGWTQKSLGTHAVSDHPLGPYKDLGLIYPNWKKGKGHNVVGLRTHEGKYAVITSEITKGEIFLSDSPYGPFNLLGEIKVDYNGFSPGMVAYQGGKGNMSNVMIIPMPDGKRYMLVPRFTSVMISEDGIQGPYKIVAGPVFHNRPDLHKHNNEDPTVWYSGGRYYIMYNHWPSKTCHFFSSEDGINDWTYRGIAYKKGDSKIFKYTDGTVNMWEFVERPTAHVDAETGHVTHFNFSVIDVGKGGDQGNDKHGSKIVVVPFDGEAFDRDMQKIVDQEKAARSKK